jgi:hypothetical protein
MKNTVSKSRRLEKQVRNLREQMRGLSDEVGDLSDYLEESRDLLYDIKEILENKLIVGEPTSSLEVLRIWAQRDPSERSPRVAIMSAWYEALELRALVEQASAPLLERFIRLVRAGAAPADIQSALGGDCPQPDLGNGPTTTGGELAFEPIKTAWLAATALRTLLSEVPKSDRERFIAFLRVDASTSSSEAD